MSGQLTMTFNYKKVNEHINIYKSDRSKNDSAELISYGLQQFLKNLILTREEKVLTDRRTDFIYLPAKDFEKRYLVICIDNKLYKLDSNESKQNEELEGKLNTLQNNLENYQVVIYKGIQAYDKFGYEFISGVIEWKRKP
jgi:hypothetical protein